MEGSQQRIARQIGAAIRRLRTERRKTQRQFAAIAGIPAAALSAYEHGRQLPDPQTIRSLLTVLGFTAEEFGHYLGPWGVVELDVRITVTVSHAAAPP
jgi:transcriptional regulator with XRE-family HTH domain